MNVIYLRHGTPKARKFMKRKLRGGGSGGQYSSSLPLSGDRSASIYDIEAGDCCLAPAPVKRRDYMVTFLGDLSPEMLAFIYRSGAWAGLSRN